jgi:hypothetical protein
VDIYGNGTKDYIFDSFCFLPVSLGYSILGNFAPSLALFHWLCLNLTLSLPESPLQYLSYTSCFLPMSRSYFNICLHRKNHQCSDGLTGIVSDAETDSYMASLETHRLQLLLASTSYILIYLTVSSILNISLDFLALLQDLARFLLFVV